MSDLKTAALRALEVLEDWESPVALPAIVALRAALAGSEWREHAPEYEKGFIDGMSEQARRSVDRFVNAMAAPIIQPEIKDDKPFGYFRAEPFGWTDCAPTDEGAIPLYERPQQPSTPPEAKTEAEKIAYCAGWWAAMDAKREEK